MKNPPCRPLPAGDGMSGLEGFRRGLLRRRQVLFKDSQGLENDACGEEARTTGDASSSASQATENAERELSLCRVESQNREIHEIDEALDRLNEGSFGVCVDCGQPLPTERLEAIPYARRCAPCQLTEEREAGGA